MALILYCVSDTDLQPGNDRISVPEMGEDACYLSCCKLPGQFEFGTTDSFRDLGTWKGAERTYVHKSVEC